MYFQNQTLELNFKVFRLSGSNSNLHNLAIELWFSNALNHQTFQPVEAGNRVGGIREELRERGEPAPELGHRQRVWQPGVVHFYWKQINKVKCITQVHQGAIGAQLAYERTEKNLWGRYNDFIASY